MIHCLVIEPKVNNYIFFSFSLLLRSMFVVARRSFSVASIRRSVISLPISESPDPLVYAQHSRLNDLYDALNNNGSPSHVWANYSNLLNALNNKDIPIEIHQQVLRRCTPSFRELRTAMVRRLRARNVPRIPHMHEGRFKAIMRNIRTLGVQPSLDDYHFVLEQFAAVGHFVGSNNVFQELKRVGHQPSHKTFGLCLQSIAHRLTLPIPKSQRLVLPIQAREIFNKYMADMRQLNAPLTAVNLDLMMRILKETLDLESFESLMRWGYGIDLSNPDRIALEYTTQTDGEPPPIPFPFNTTALNTTIDMLGLTGNVSKLVQAFEVLTQPLPGANQHSFNAFEEDDDFGVSVNVSSIPPPYASPNTTTYNMLLRHLSRAGHSILARHYIIQAMELDRQTERILRRSVCKWDKFKHKVVLRQPLTQVPAPHFSINRQHLLSVMGEGNVDKDLGLLRWLFTKLPYIIRKKTKDLEQYTSLREDAIQSSIDASLPPPPPPPSDFTTPPSDPTTPPSDPTTPPSDPTTPSSDPTTPPSDPTTPSSDPTTPPSDSTTPSSDSTTPPSDSTTPSSDSTTPPSNFTTPDLFDLDLEDSTPPETPRIKYFNIDLHIRILTRNLFEIKNFARNLEFVLSRTSERVKDRLGRRIWAGKDIYLSTDARRLNLTRDSWRSIVNFQPRRDTFMNRRQDRRGGLWF